jgi:hypothetical protein
VRPGRLATVGVVLLTLGGCGGEEEGDSEREPRAGEGKPSAARSDRDCIELWNSETLPGTVGQKSPRDYVIEIAADGPVDALVRYQGGECIVVVPFRPGATRGYAFVALKGRAPYNLPGGQIPIHPDADEDDFNARANPDGSLERG